MKTEMKTQREDREEKKCRRERKTDRKMRCLGLIPNWNLTSVWGWRT